MGALPDEAVDPVHEPGQGPGALEVPEQQGDPDQQHEDRAGEGLVDVIGGEVGGEGEDEGAARASRPMLMRRQIARMRARASSARESVWTGSTVIPSVVRREAGVGAEAPVGCCGVCEACGGGLRCAPPGDPL